MSHPKQCSVCDSPIDAWGRDGTRCPRCSQPCPTCNGVIGFCSHDLPTVFADLVPDADKLSDPFRRVA